MLTDAQWFTIAVTIITVGGGVDIWLLRLFSRPCNLHSGIQALAETLMRDQASEKDDRKLVEVNQGVLRSEIFKAISELRTEMKGEFAEQSALIESLRR